MRILLGGGIFVLIVLVVIYMGIATVLILLGITLAIIYLFLCIGGIAGLPMIAANNHVSLSMKFWQPYLIILGLAAFTCAILIPVYHLAGFISWVEVLLLWLIEAIFFYVFVGIPGRYLEKLKTARNTSLPPR